MRVLIVTGSRNCEDKRFVLDKLKNHSHDKLIVGDADGVDKIVRDVYYYATVKFAEWDKYGDAAGPLRNSMMIKEALFTEDVQSIECVAFWDGKVKNSGTLNCITMARQANIPVTIYMV